MDKNTHRDYLFCKRIRDISLFNTKENNPFQFCIFQFKFCCVFVRRFVASFSQVSCFAQNVYANLLAAALLQSVQLFKGGKQLFFFVADNRVKAGGSQGSSHELPLTHARVN